MKNTTHLNTLVLSALVIASTAPMVAQADTHMQGIFLASGCPAHGCPSSKNTTANAPATLTEAQLLSSLDSKGRALYLGLSAEGKALALQLASQSEDGDKTAAVQEAQKRMQN